MRKLGSRAMEEKARIRKMDPGIFFMQVLDFYRRPMLYYYNDCKYVLKTVSAAGTAAHFLYDILCSPKEVYNLRRKIEDEFTGGKIREEHGKAYD